MFLYNQQIPVIWKTVSYIVNMWKVVFIIVTTCGFQQNWCQFFNCHDDPSLSPDEGSVDEMKYTWLGALQYIHIKHGNPHYFRVPRVVLIAKQFVLSTAVDAARIPDGYALGNVIFGEYERDEAECGQTMESLRAGKECETAAVLVPLSDVLLHPEYNIEHIHSIAILKLITPLQSSYMVPVCLPFKNFIVTRNGKRSKDKFYHLDFTNDVPRDLMSEDKEIRKLSVLPNDLCYLYAGAKNVSLSETSSIMCTTGCGFHSGAPSLVHEHTGHWSIIALAQGSAPCPDPLRSGQPPPPPRHTLLHPYVPWITAAITGKAIGGYNKDDPFGYTILRTKPTRSTQAFVGHWWMGGIACFNRGEAADKMFKFYNEIFQVKPAKKAALTYYLELYAARSVSIICVKIGLPYNLVKPRVWGLDTDEVKVLVPLLDFGSNPYSFQIDAWGYNDTDDESSSSSSSED